MLLMLALMPGSGMLWPEEGRLMRMMPAFQPVSDIDFPQKEQMMLMMVALRSWSCILLLSQERSATDAGDVGFKGQQVP